MVAPRLGTVVAHGDGHMKRVPMGHELLCQGEIGSKALNTHAARVAAGEHARSLTLRASTNVAVVVLLHLYIPIDDVVGVSLARVDHHLSSGNGLGPHGLSSVLWADHRQAVETGRN